ncbi:hypothetical protein [Paraburkholderia sp. GAS334]|uniref:hypothetical protein n=1 Tax=Paraburkholderia sp. GAS334 TaxID=3035131 RepID=UPI003D1A4DDA
MKRSIRLTTASLLLFAATCEVHAARHEYSPLQSIEKTSVTASIQTGHATLDKLIQESFIGVTPDGDSRPEPGLLIAAPRVEGSTPSLEELKVRIAGIGR